MHPQRKLLDVQHDVGDVLADSRDAAEFMQHPVNLHRRDRGPLQRGQQDAADGISKRHSEAALQRLGNDGGDARWIGAWLDLKLFGLDQRLPIPLNNCALPHTTNTFRTASGAVDVPWTVSKPKPFGSVPGRTAPAGAVRSDRT